MPTYGLEVDALRRERTAAGMRSLAELTVEEARTAERRELRSRTVKHEPVAVVADRSILAPTLEESRGWVARGQLLGFTQLFNVLGQPAVSVPCGFSQNGLPIGMQLVGRPGSRPAISFSSRCSGVSFSRACNAGPVTSAAVAAITRASLRMFRLLGSLVRSTKRLNQR